MNIDNVKYVYLIKSLHKSELNKFKLSTENSTKLNILLWKQAIEIIYNYQGQFNLINFTISKMKIYWIITFTKSYESIF